MKRFILFCFVSFLFSPVVVQAQVTSGTGVKMGDISTQLGNGGTFVKPTTKYEGTPYFSGDWVRGYLILNNNSRTKNIAFRYNMRYDRIEFMKNDKLYSIPDKKLSGFKIKTTGPYIIFKNGFKTNVDDINANTLLRVIADGKVKFLAHHSVIVQKNIPTYGAAATINKFHEDIDYYLVTPDGKFHKVDPKPSDVYSVLPGKNKKLKKYMSRINLSTVKAPQRVKKMVEIYNMILKKQDSSK